MVTLKNIRSVEPAVVLEADEVILKIVHRHWVVLFTNLFSLAVFALLPLLAAIIVLVTTKLNSHTTINLSDFTPHLVFFYLTWLLFIWMALSYTLLNHYLDVWTITNRRIIAVDQQGFFRRHIGSFRLEKLQDMNVEINGIIATLLDYGTVEAETASGSTGEFRAYHLPHPQQLKDLILDTARKLNEPLN